MFTKLAKLKIFIFSVQGGLLVMSLGTFISALVFIYQVTEHTRQAVNSVPASSLPKYLYTLIVALLFIFAFIIFQTFLRYQRVAYDPKYGLKYQKLFDSSDMRKVRAKAAQSLKAHIADTKSEIDECVDKVLDMFEDLAFYRKGMHITNEVIHHHFYEWIRGYMQAAEQYIKDKQKDQEPWWEELKDLKPKIDAIEASKRKVHPDKLRLSSADLDEFLDWEIEEADHAASSQNVGSMPSS
jgi:hypothetical protein